VAAFRGINCMKSTRHGRVFLCLIAASSICENVDID
jgi:hypothetical protein